MMDRHSKYGVLSSHSRCSSVMVLIFVGDMVIIRAILAEVANEQIPRAFSVANAVVADLRAQ